MQMYKTDLTNTIFYLIISKQSKSIPKFQWKQSTQLLVNANLKIYLIVEMFMPVDGNLKPVTWIPFLV